MQQREGLELEVTTARRREGRGAETRTAIDIEGLVAWAIGAEKADRIVDWMDAEAVRPGSGSAGHSADGCWAAERYGALGTWIDCAGSGGYAAAQLDDDAELVYRTMRETLCPDQLRDIVGHARSGTRPDHTPCPVVELVVRPELAGQGKGWRPRIRREAKTRREYCPVAIERHDNADRLDSARWLWRSWREGLRRLHGALQAQASDLRRWRLRPFQIPAEPWREASNGKAARRVRGEREDGDGDINSQANASGGA